MRANARISALGIAAALAAALATGTALAEHGGGMGHGKHGGGGHSDGAGHDAAGHDGQDGKGHGGHGRHGAMPGMVEPVCRESGKMPPAYCAPSYKVASSVPGLQIVDAGPVSDRTLWVKLSHLGLPGVPFSRNIVIVGGGGELAGSVMVGGGWQQQTVVQLVLEGNDTVYGTRAMHLHAFPLTGP